MSIEFETIRSLFPTITFEQIDDSNLFVPKSSNFVYSDNKGYVRNLSHKQYILIAQMMSNKIFPKNDFKFSLISIQDFYDLCNSDSKEGKIIRKMVSIDSITPFLNREAFKDVNGKIIAFPDPVVIEKPTGLKYDGEVLNVKIGSDFFDTLQKTKLFRPSYYKLKIPKMDDQFSALKIGMKESFIYSRLDGDGAVSAWTYINEMEPELNPSIPLFIKIRVARRSNINQT